MVKMILAVTGNPVLHSKSPLLFNADFKSRRIAAVYTRLAADSALEALTIAKKIGIKGLNITTPFKEDIISHLDDIDTIARQIDAVNTVVFDKKSGKSKGYNTDYLGVINSFQKKGIDLTGKKTVVIGCGGAGRAAIYGLLLNKASVCIINRTISKAKLTAQKFGCRYSPISSLEKEINEADILISTISTSDKIIPTEFLRKNLIVFDANYKSSPLIEDAQNIGCQTIIKGMDWLLNQAIPAYKYFTGHEADEKVMQEALQDSDFQKNEKNNLFLTGFMGSGKSSCGKALASLLQVDLLDTDQEIEKKEKRSIAEIFKENGEEYFRNIETEILYEITACSKTKRRQVISSGGGIVLKEQNRKYISNNFLPIWLYTGVDETIRRLQNGDENSRPLLPSKIPLKEIEKLFTDRIPFYAMTTALIINSDNKNIKETAEKIYDEIDKTFPN